METAWEFNTANFRVTLEIEPEDMAPEDSFQFQEDIDAVRNGDVEWFCAIVAVYYKGRKIAWDSLGGCAYRSVEDFYTSHRKYKEGGYFTDMVSEAIREARKVICDMPKLRCA